jgi:hypothetical protein
MKRFSAFLTALLFTLLSFAQAPQKMSYQAVIRNSSDQLITNKEIGLRVSIVQNSIDGSLVYQEIYNPNHMTNKNGLLTIEIGTGVPLTGTFSEIDWADGPYFIKTEIDPSGGTNYTITGTSQLLSVPYALHSESSSNLKGEITESQISDLKAYLLDITDEKIGDLADVDLHGLATGKTLKYDADQGKWIASDDLNTTYIAGAGLNLAANQFGVTFGGSGEALTVSHSDHNHFGQDWSGSAENGLQVTNSSTTGRAITGINSAVSGVNYGIYGKAASENGFGGYFDNSTLGIAVAGFQTDYGINDQASFWQPAGLFAGRNGIIGLTKTPGGYGIIAWNKDVGTSTQSTGLYARTEAPNSYCGMFITSAGNGVLISTPAGKTGLTVSGGSKNAAVPTEDGTRLLYTEESTEVWFTDYGFGRLNDGVAVIMIDPIFAQTVNLGKQYHVFTEVYGPAAVYVDNRTSTHFEVHLREGHSEVEFSYRIVAKRLSYEDQRLEKVPWDGYDKDLYPENSGINVHQ